MRRHCLHRLPRRKICEDIGGKRECGEKERDSDAWTKVSREWDSKRWGEGVSLARYDAVTSVLEEPSPLVAFEDVSF